MIMSTHSIGVANERRAIEIYESFGYQCWKPSPGRYAAADQRDILAIDEYAREQKKFKKTYGTDAVLLAKVDGTPFKKRTGADFIAFKPGLPYRFVQVKTGWQYGVSKVKFNTIEDLMKWNEESRFRSQQEITLGGRLFHTNLEIDLAFWDLLVFSKPKTRWRPIIYTLDSSTEFLNSASRDEIPTLSLSVLYEERKAKRNTEEKK